MSEGFYIPPRVLNLIRLYLSIDLMWWIEEWGVS